jgi:magnesium transporter
VTTALLFERDRVAEVQDWTERIDHVGRSSILWIDLDEPDARQVELLAGALELSRTSAEWLAETNARPFFRDFDSYLHVTACAPRRNDETELVKIDCLVGERWIVTVHDQPVEAFNEFRERMTESSGEIGRLDGPEFLAHLLSWVLEAYLREFEEIELALEQFDERVMHGEFEEPDRELARLVELRREVGRLRRGLVSHREVFLALAQPELEAITSSDHAERFQMLRGQLEHAIQGARDSRDAVVGSFDVLIARTEHRTNEIMKVLTLGALLFLPGALIAAILGMNFRVGLFETGWYFWAVCAGIVAVGAATIAVARSRDWI